jgi:hypothetical protein
MRFRILVVLIIVYAAPAAGAETVWFPGTVGFLPPLASPEEARVSAQQVIGSSRLRVGIGNVLDLVHFRYDGGGTLGVGLDAFAFGLSSTIGGARLKIDLIDGSFGAHATWNDSSAWSWRLRALHVSAHVSDGTYDQGSGEWAPDRVPIPFSRNFFELTGAHAFRSPFLLRPYAMAGIAWFNRPKEIRPFTFGCGLDAALPLSPSPYAAFHFSLLGVPEYAGTFTAELGVRFGPWERNGLRVHLGFTSGLEPYGQIYNQRVTAWSVGAAFDFWELTGGGTWTMSGASPR